MLDEYKSPIWKILGGYQIPYQPTPMKALCNSYHKLIAIILCVTICFSYGNDDREKKTFDSVKRIADAIRKYRLRHRNHNPPTLESLVPSYLKEDDLWIPNADPNPDELPLIRMVYLHRQGYRLPDNKALVIAITSSQDPHGYYIYIDDNCKALFINGGGIR